METVLQIIAHIVGCCIGILIGLYLAKWDREDCKAQSALLISETREIIQNIHTMKAVKLHEEDMHKEEVERRSKQEEDATC